MRESRIYGIVSSLVVCLIVLLILLFVQMGYAPVPEEEGIVVSFGSEDFGGGYGETAETAPTPPVAPPPTETTPSENDLMTQENDESLALEQEKEDEEKARAEEARRLREKEEARILAEQIAKEKAEAERKRKEQEAKDNAAKLGSLFGSHPNSEGSGNSEGDTKEGNPVGKGTSGGNSWSLNGRNLMGRLAEPSYDKNVEGEVVVRIRVNEKGRVTSATIGGGTISDKGTQDAAIKAALSARFTSGDHEVIGSITYNFRLR